MQKLIRTRIARRRQIDAVGWRGTGFFWSGAIGVTSLKQNFSTLALPHRPKAYKYSVWLVGTLEPESPKSFQGQDSRRAVKRARINSRGSFFSLVYLAAVLTC
jgi:hypothetical protein